MRISPYAIALFLATSLSLSNNSNSAGVVVEAWAPPRMPGLGLRRRQVRKPVVSLQVLAERPSTELSSSRKQPPSPPSGVQVNQAAGEAARAAKKNKNQQQQNTKSGEPRRAGTPTHVVGDESPSVIISHSADEQVHQQLQQHQQREDGAENVRNLSLPQIHLPPRLVPGVAWQHHHTATTRLVHEHWPKRQPKVEDINDNNDRKEPSELDKKRELLVSRTPEWKALEDHVATIEKTHLRDLLQDEARSDAMFAEHDGVYLDYSRQRATLETLSLLQDLAKRQKLEERIQSMVTGEKINFTEERAVLHTALRADRDEVIEVDGENVVEEVYEVLDQIKAFTEGVRSGEIRGYTGKRIRNIISVGIGGSYLGPEFLHEVLKTEPEGINAALGYSLRFLANVDPVDVERTCADLDPEETLIVIVSKTFTTAETMLNARTMRQWLWDFMGNHKDVVRKHVVACASVSATENVKNFGIDTDKYFFRFWDWVGGRYSVCSAAGAVPISLLYGYDLFEKFLKVT